MVLDGTCGSKEYSAPPCTSSKCLPVDQSLMSCSHTGLDSKTQSRALHFALHNIGSPYHVVKKSEHHSPSIPVKKILKQTNPPHRHKFINTWICTKEESKIQEFALKKCKNVVTDIITHPMHSVTWHLLSKDHCLPYIRYPLFCCEKQWSLHQQQLHTSLQHRAAKVTLFNK